VAFLKMASLKTDVPVVLFFVVASILLTFPVAFEFGRLPGGSGDNLFWAYHVGWLTKSILTHSSPIHDGSVFYPVGFNLIYFSLDSFLAFPFAAIGGAVFGYNMIFMLSFVASGLAAYLLVYYLSRNRLAGLLSGFLFAFSPYRMAQSLGHFEIMGTFWIPLFILYLHKAMARRKNWDAVAASVFFVLAALTSGYYAAIDSILLVVIVVAAYLASKLRSEFSRREWRVWLTLPSMMEIREYLRAAAVFLLTCVPTIVLWATYLTTTVPKRSISDSIAYSADPLDYVTPNRLSPLFSHVVQSFRSMAGGEHDLYLGMSALLLSLYALVILRKRRDVKTYAVLGAVFFVLSLGPALHFWDRPVIFLGYPVPMPYLIVTFLPSFLLMRAVSRLGVIVILSSCVLAGIGFADLARRLDVRDKKMSLFKRSNLIAFLFILLAVLEFASVPYPMTNTSIAAYDWLSKQPGDFAIVEYPVGHNDASTMYGTIIHGKKTVSGEIEIDPGLLYPDPRWPFEITSILDAVAFFQPDASGRFSRQVDMHLYRSLGVRYALFRSSDYRSAFGSEAWNHAMHLVSQTEGISYVGDIDGIFVYQVLGSEQATPFVIFGYYFGSHWYPPEVWSDNQTHRWMSNDASLIIFNPLPTRVALRLKFVAASLATQRDLEAYVDNKFLGRFAVLDSAETSFTTPWILLEENSQKIVSLHTIQGPESPASLGINTDYRLLSIAFRKVEIDWQNVSDNESRLIPSSNARPLFCIPSIESQQPMSIAENRSPKPAPVMGTRVGNSGEIDT